MPWRRDDGRGRAHAGGRAERKAFEEHGETSESVRLSADFSALHNPGDYNDLDAVPEGILAVWEDGRGDGRWPFQSPVATA